MVQPDGKSRISKIDTYLNVAEAFAYRSTCLKRKYGAVIVKDDVVVSTGYNGSPRGYYKLLRYGFLSADRTESSSGAGV
ncbi:MAG: hypothetical protein ACLR6B_02785 [Blautia sp.]